jgi:membrane associated rhomboid family serine protease
MELRSRSFSDFRRAMDLSLVLEQEGIPHELRRERVHPITGAVASGVAFSLALVAMYVRMGPESPGSPWIDRGSADAAAILRGEWWRAVTALTLHADAGHVAGNAVMGGLLLALLARSLGPGVASAVMLLSGVAGTFLAAALRRQDFVSIGASTAVFGALGALAALPRDSRRVWMPVIGGLALLSFLGTAKRADVTGHLCGFVSGLLVGAAVSRLPKLQSRAAQAFLAVAAGCLPVVAWLAAFR